MPDGRESDAYLESVHRAEPGVKDQVGAFLVRLAESFFKEFQILTYFRDGGARSREYLREVARTADRLERHHEAGEALACRLFRLWLHAVELDCGPLILMFSEELHVLMVDAPMPAGERSDAKAPIVAMFLDAWQEDIRCGLIQEANVLVEHFQGQDEKSQAMVGMAINEAEAALVKRFETLQGFRLASEQRRDQFLAGMSRYERKIVATMPQRAGGFSLFRHMITAVHVDDIELMMLFCHALDYFVDKAAGSATGRHAWLS